ncbi:MAG: NADH-quinone oxidoreductase subunit C [Steroidobacteraceae bacterium]
MVSTERIASLAQKIDARLGDRAHRLPSLPHELAYEIDAPELLASCFELRDAPELAFEVLIDIAGIDYLHYGRDEWQTETASRTGFSRGVDPLTLTQPSPPQGERVPKAGEGGGRFAVAYHLLSVTHNHRVRLRTRCPDEPEPVVDSVVPVWASANWFEREAFDLFGILFRGHPDLRRLLTDYGFIGHPFRKDFPLIGNVEVRYDPVKGRVVYEPVSIEPRVLVPKVIRDDDHRYDPALKDQPPGAKPS